MGDLEYSDAQGRPAHISGTWRNLVAAHASEACGVIHGGSSPLVPTSVWVYNTEMKYIGRGWQYTVYDIGNDRVLKKYNSRLQAYWIMLKQNFPYVSYPLWKFHAYHDGCKKTALGSIKKIQDTKINTAIFGNPKILNELDYEQDKATPLHEFFKNLTLAEGERTIDEFVKFNKILLENRLVDKSFLIGKNYAIDREGNMILIDIGELYSTEESIRKQIALKPWDHPYVTSTIPVKFRKYFAQEMNKHFDERLLQF